MLENGAALAVRLVETEGPDILNGAEQVNRMDRLESDDSLNGRPGDDRIFGGTGDDSITGGPERTESSTAEESIGLSAARGSLRPRGMSNTVAGLLRGYR